MSKAVIGSAEAVRRIKALRQQAVGILDDGAIASLILARIKGRFMQGVAPDGTPWPGLLETTLERKRRSGGSKPEQLLYQSGRLYNSIKIIKGSSAGILAGATGVSARIGVSDPGAAEYGRLHNYGYGQEKRQFIGLNRLDVIAVSGMLRRKLKSIAKG